MSDSQPTVAAVEAVLAEFVDPESGRPVTQMGQTSDVKIEGGRLSLTLALTTFSAVLWQETREALEQLLRAKFPDLSEVAVELAICERPPEKIGQIGLPVKSVIAVASGKGGVGKSTIAAALAYGLHRAGSSVGLMDADVYGPSIPHMLGVEGRPEAVNNRLQPIVVDGLRVMSMGFLVPPGEAVIWRGPMLHGAITQFLRDTDWGELDYLIIDMPPGTGDIALTLSQLLPLTGAVVVCTPQDVALLDAVKAIVMFSKVNIPVLGMVENMSYFDCSSCGERHEIFGSGGAKRRAEEMDVPFLGDVPINVQLRIRGDEGDMAGNFDDATSSPFLESICGNLIRKIVAGRNEGPPLPSLSVLG